VIAKNNLINFYSKGHSSEKFHCINMVMKNINWGNNRGNKNCLNIHKIVSQLMSTRKAYTLMNNKKFLYQYLILLYKINTGFQGLIILVNQKCWDASISMSQLSAITCWVRKSNLTLLYVNTILEPLPEMHYRI
jgi:hypothetical protein